MRCEGRSKGNTWWNEEVKGGVLREKDTHKVMCQIVPMKIRVDIKHEK